MYLADDNRATGLARWLTVGLRILDLLEGVVRQRLSESGEQLAGLYAGNPKRTTARPTAESLLRAFKGIALSFVTIAGQTHRHLTPLSGVQHKILGLLNYPTTIYVIEIDAVVVIAHSDDCVRRILRPVGQASGHDKDDDRLIAIDHLTERSITASLHPHVDFELVQPANVGIGCADGGQAKEAIERGL